MRLNLARDNLLDSMANSGADASALRAMTNQFRSARDQRSADEDYVKCPRCWAQHLMRLNFGHTVEDERMNPELSREKLCDDCQQFILSEFPNHPSAPHIRAAIAAQREMFTAK